MFALLPRLWRSHLTPQEGKYYFLFVEVDGDDHYGDDDQLLSELAC